MIRRADDLDGACDEMREAVQPTRERWQILRSGLVNLYRFDEQEFRFDDGHLLLRGNNATGKSRVLALQLPFLLDGEISPSRVEPDRDPSKRMEWNLLMGTKHDDRLGYSWIEFGRVDADGVAHFVCIGCGLRATRGRPLKKWFFLTNERVGIDFDLVTAERHPLTRDRLREAVGPTQVFDVAREYRRAIDENLFGGMGAVRYDALINLLIELRQPQLSRSLDEKKLSRALSDALTPPSQHVLDDVAESFRGLEADRTARDGYRAAHAAVAEFLMGYRLYLEVAIKRRSDAVRERHSAYEATQRALKQAREKLDKSRLFSTKMRQRIADLEGERERLGAEVRGLEESPEMRGARQLDDLRQRVRERASYLQGCQEERQRADTRRDTTRQALDELATRLESVDAETARLSDEVIELAASLGQASTMTTLCESALPGDVDRAVLERQLADCERRLREGAALLERLAAQLGETRQAVALATQLHVELEGQLDAARDDYAASRAAADAAMVSFAEEYESWWRELRELDLGGWDEFDDAMRAWADSASGLSPLDVAIATARERSNRALLDEFAAVERGRDAARSQLEPLLDERQQLEQGVDQAPPARPARDVQSRVTRDGAPLWQLVDFVDDVSLAHRAGIEAALESAGWLDAWVTSDGRLIDEQDRDVFLVGIVDGSDDEAGASLRAVLRPAAEPFDAKSATVSHAAIDSLLARIGLFDARGDEADTGAPQISTDGHWRCGPARGYWAKPQPEYLGASARQARRRERLRELRLEIERLESQLAELQREHERIEERRRALAAEVAAAPDRQPLVLAQARLESARTQLDRVRERLAISESKLADLRQSERQAASELEQSAADLHLSEFVDDLAALPMAIHRFVGVARDWLRSRGHGLQIAVDVHATQQRLNEATADCRRLATKQRQAEQEHQDVIGRCRALETSIGQSVASLLAALDERRQEQRELASTLDDARDQQIEISNTVAVCEHEIESHSERLDERSELRDAAFIQLRILCERDLLGVALPDVDTSLDKDTPATRYVELAREIDRLLQNVSSSDDAWERQQSQVYQRVEALKGALLMHGDSPTTDMVGEILRVTVVYQSRSTTMSMLESAYREECDRRSELLDAEERRIIDNHLIGEVATHLGECLRQGEEWVASTNRELETRPTSTGMKLRFRWQPLQDGPPGLKAARQHLLSADAWWSEDEREAVGDFLQQQIERVRTADATGSWSEHLAEALDYRAWHEFAIERYQDGEWKTLTKRTHGTGSGGEKAVALTIPQFAAAAAHYQSAASTAPRLILLDEVFAGIDDDMRDKCMGLLQAFDLDFIMTSEREWGCYASLNQLSIYELTQHSGLEAVATTRWSWNGRELQAKDGDVRVR